MPRIDDEHMLHRFRNGDHRAFKAIVELYQHKLYALAHSIAGNREDAEDIVQEAFLRAYNARESFRGQAGFGTWLYRIVYNLCVDLKRHDARVDTEPYEDTRKLAADASMPRVVDPLRQMESAETARIIRQALDELPVEQRTAVILREMEGLSYKEIARVMGCSTGTVMSRLHYGRRRLQEMLRPFHTP